MLHIALCDDRKDQLMILDKYTKEYIELNSIDAQIQKFTSPDALLITCEKQRFHIYILDIVMPMINGIELGKEIRKIDKEAQIIYASTEAAFALESFSANPINYLVKPIEKEKLFTTLRLAISRANTKEEIITVKTKEGLRVVKLSSIIFCEYINHSVQFVLMGGEKIKSSTIKGSFVNYIQPLLLKDEFIQPHSSYLVNMNRVEVFSKDGFIMRGGSKIPIPQKKYPPIRDRYMDYLLSRDGAQ